MQFARRIPHEKWEDAGDNEKTGAPIYRCRLCKAEIEVRCLLEENARRGLEQCPYCARKLSDMPAAKPHLIAEFDRLMDLPQSEERIIKLDALAERLECLEVRMGKKKMSGKKCQEKGES